MSSLTINLIYHSTTADMFSPSGNLQNSPTDLLKNAKVSGFMIGTVYGPIVFVVKTGVPTLPESHKEVHVSLDTDEDDPMK